MCPAINYAKLEDLATNTKAIHRHGYQTLKGLRDVATTDVYYHIIGPYSCTVCCQEHTVICTCAMIVVYPIQCHIITTTARIGHYFG